MIPDLMNDLFLINGKLLTDLQIERKSSNAKPKHE